MGNAARRSNAEPSSQKTPASKQLSNRTSLSSSRDRHYGKRFLNLMSTPNVPFWSRRPTIDIDRVTLYST